MAEEKKPRKAGKRRNFAKIIDTLTLHCKVNIKILTGLNLLRPDPTTTAKIEAYQDVLAELGGAE